MVLQRDAKHKMSWKESDARYIARGKAMAIKRDSKWNDDLDEMNRGKVGRPFKYPHSMMAFIAITRVALDLSYRTCRTAPAPYTWPANGAIWPRRTIPRYGRG